MSDFDESVDFIVVGSGAGSMCAALYLQSRGQTVMILEKTGLVGGTTAKSGGVMWIPNNPFMRRDGVEDSHELAATYLESVTGDQADAPAATPARRHTFLTEAPRMVEFLLSRGIRLNRVSYWPDYYEERPGGLAAGRTVVAEPFNVKELGAWRDKLRTGFLTMPATLEEALALPDFRRSWKSRWLLLRVIGRSMAALLTGKRWVSAGAALQGRMLQAVLKAGIEVRTSSPVRELILEEGAVKGVVTEREGRPWRVGSRLGVLVNAGGFSLNQPMRDRYQPGTSAAWSNAAPGDTGEMIEEMERHGAALAQMEEMVGYQSTLAPGKEGDDIKPSAQRLTAAPHAILVDRSGVRYMNEGGSYMAYCKGMLERDKTVAAVPSWAIFDSQYLRKYMLAGTMAGSKKPQRWYDEGYLKQGDTIADLARLIGVEPAVLEATIARFNGFVKNNRDEDFQRGERAYDLWLGDRFHRPSQTLGAIEQGPFYAVPVVPGDVGTFGGVVTDEHARVLRGDGSVIPGLYATGISTASVMGRFYPGAGCSIGPAFTWAYVAAQCAAKEGDR